MFGLARRLPPVAPLLDVVWAAGTAAAVAVTLLVAHQSGAARPDAGTYATGALVGVPLLVRRRYPLGTLLGCALLLMCFYTLYPHAGLAPAVPLAVALYTAAEHGHLRWSLLVVGFYLAAGAFVLLARQHLAVLVTLTGLVEQGSLVVAICLLGEAVRSRRGWAAETRERVREAEQAAAAEREHESARRVAQERVRIARDLHDVLAHTISALGIQARVILDGLPDGPAPVRSAAQAILSTSREAMSEVRATVGLLRAAGGEGEPPRSPAPGVSHVDSLLATARATGLRARCETVGVPVPLPAGVDVTLYRIVQESLTNVVRHARASSVTVTLDYRHDCVEVRVADDGRGPTPGTGGDGFGLIGIRERAAALGGTASAGPGPQGGFQVLARLPHGGAAGSLSR